MNKQDEATLQIKIETLLKKGPWFAMIKRNSSGSKQDFSEPE